MFLFSSQRLVPQVSMDQFLCCGTPYRALRDAVTRVLLENKSDAFVMEVQVRERPAEESV